MAFFVICLHHPISSDGQQSLLSPLLSSSCVLQEENAGREASSTSTTEKKQRERETRGRGGVMEEKDTSQSKEQSPPTQPQDQSIETNGGVLAVKEETAEAISKSTENDPAPQSDVLKKRSSFRLVRAAMSMVRRRAHKKSNSLHVEVPPKNLLRRVGSMRPLHVPQPALTPPPSAPTIENSHLLQPSPSSSPFSSASSLSNSTSRYASAPNLQELGRRAGCNSDDDDEFINNGDEMIDVKAEEFIANFYKQMRLQHS